MISISALFIVSLSIFILSLIKFCKLSFDENCDEKIGYMYIMGLSALLLMYLSVMGVGFYRFNGMSFI